ncbi:alpha/beta fold hydrolase [Streptomyces pactum]|uniref:Alpha/beta fold hydrolase n=1 Tax=Streptomyces pactum TaxID=68249 RepID=A0ABS0NG18_9ACTN|nr:alpha/beta hydrolase [Streptomyces pactum]MBH5334124.1 alpha/beta fold hydrolase [Streptomyces pactum]
MTTASANGIAIGYDDLGPRTCAVPLLLVHGHPFDRSMWRPQLQAAAAAGHRVIAPDLRGYGESTVVPGSTPFPVFATDLAALLDGLGIGEVALGGLSMGGQIVMEFQRLFPGRVRGLLLADTAAEPETADGRAWRRAMADRLLREGMAPYADEVLTKMVAPRTVETMPDVATHVRLMMGGTPPEGAAAALRGRAERPDYRPVLAGVTVPTLVVVGADDEFTPVEDARTLHRLVAGSRLRVVEGAAHMPNLERPAEFNAAMLEFLDEVAAASTARRSGPPAGAAGAGAGAAGATG